MGKQPVKQVAANRKAFHDYFIIRFKDRGKINGIYPQLFNMWYPIYHLQDP